MNIPCFVYPFSYWSLWSKDCKEHAGIFFLCVWQCFHFSWVNTCEWNCWVKGMYVLNFIRNCHIVFQCGCPILSIYLQCIGNFFWCQKVYGISWFSLFWYARYGISLCFQFSFSWFHLSVFFLCVWTSSLLPLSFSGRGQFIVKL